jgi:predicted  nucleic acid-binding Zn-ribbon protein
MADRRLAILEDLERAEQEVAAELVEIDELHADCEQVRLTAHELVELLARLPEERAAGRRALEETAGALEEARKAAEQAGKELASAEPGGDPERLAAARRFHIRAQDALHLAERQAEQAGARAKELEASVKAAREQTKDLAARARELAEALSRRRRVALETDVSPDAGPAELADWGTQARAALLVARNQVAADRDALVRQANELASSAVGAPVAAMSADGAADLLRRTLED